MGMAIANNLQSENSVNKLLTSSVSSRLKSGELRCFIVLIVVLLLSCLALKANAVDIYVAANGSDKNSGTKEQPLATLHLAIRKARELRRLNDPSIKDGVNIVINKGIYQLHEPIVLRAEDSGTKAHPTEIIANGKVVLSGGTKVGGWEKFNGILKNLPAAAKGKIWVANIPNFGGNDLQFRQLWVNGIEA